MCSSDGDVQTVNTSPLPDLLTAKQRCTDHSVFLGTALGGHARCDSPLVMMAQVAAETSNPRGIFDVGSVSDVAFATQRAEYAVDKKTPRAGPFEE